MQPLDGELVLSATDLTGFAACEHLTQLELSVTRGEQSRPQRDDPMLDVLTRRGGEHESAHVERLRAEGKTVVEIAGHPSTRAGLRQAQQETLAAMHQGVDVIYQATFFDERWRGHADFLLRVQRPSDLGDYSYEVADTKLARRVKAAALLQMCSYSEQLERLQGVAPVEMHVITGDREEHPFKVADYSAYFRTLKARYEALVLGPTIVTYPEPVEHCSICRWADQCNDRRRADDHLSLVAKMRRDQSRRLVDAGVTTRTGLAQLPPATPVAGIGDATLEALRHQAELQVLGAGCVPPLVEPLAPEAPVDGEGGAWPKRGWAALPEPSPGDLFFDMEGDPFALEGGLEYLFGVIDVAGGKPAYHAFWAHDRDGEKRAFEEFISFVMERLARFPDLHIYHYAPYEPVALKRLMGAHASCEREVDELLRGEVFVDLYAVVRQSVRIGTESYSLKQVEKLYMHRHAGEVNDGGSSIVAYEAFLESRDQATLDGIQRYNQDDCRSTLRLRDWLEDRRIEVERDFGPIPRPEPQDGAPSEALSEREAATAARLAALTAGVPDVRDQRTDEQQARWLLARLLDWHRRESKPEWWAYYNRLGLSDEELLDDRECIAGLEFVEELAPEKKSRVYRYEFAPQEHKFHIGSTVFDPITMRAAGEVMGVDDTLCLIDLKRGPSLDGAPHPRALIPSMPISTRPLEHALARVAEFVIANGIDAPGPSRAARNLLRRCPPRINGVVSGEPIAHDDESGLAAARRVVPLLDDSYLAIQGPPGSGKTFTGAHMIVDLIEAGQRVGVTAHTHAAIGNLLEAVCGEAGERGVKIVAIQKAEEHQGCGVEIVECVESNPEVDGALANDEVNLVAGTAWLWAREAMAGTVDVLFVDEAGQKSLADVIAVSGAARKIVLLGDPQQLAQPSKGDHPQGAELSALEHLLGEHPTIPEPMGLFLATTYRMHPRVCAFVSEVVYESRLHSEPTLELQEVGGRAGLQYVPVEHRGNRSSSPEEVARVTAIVDELLGQPWTNKDGDTRALELDDILIVAPYNVQVARLQQVLPEGARVGTVDKFQGREAPVTIYSMATSSAEDAPRAMEFLYDLHRLNVAVSRARALSIIVCSPELLQAQCRTPEQMHLANTLCRFAEQAALEESD